MKRSLTEAHKTIEHTSAAEFDRLLNEAIGSLADKNPVVTINQYAVMAGQHQADIRYTVEHITFVDEWEEYLYENGDEYRCGDCPFFVPSSDRRRRYVECPKSRRNVGWTSQCCEGFFRALKKGEICVSKNGERW